MAGLFRNIIIAGMLFFAYNEFLAMYRASVFDDITFQQNSSVITDKMGEPVAGHNCKTDPKPSVLPYADTLCKDTVEVIVAYKPCLIEIRCPGWHYIAYDRSGRMISKYSLTP